MYNERLEQLIDAALTDGELTEKEKQILFKKAQEMGVDLDEFEMVLDARLVKLKKAEEEKAKSSAPKSNKLGDVKKCPACGAIVQSYQGVCAECGYAFENIEANAAVKELTNLLRKANGNIDRAQIIDTFPIPMDKASLIAFITWLAPQSLDVGHSCAESYQKKYKEAIDKAKISFASDKDMAPLIAKYKEDKKIFKRENVKENVMASLEPILMCVVWLVFIGLPSAGILYWIFGPNTDGNLEDCSAAIVKAINKNNLEKAVELYAEYDDDDDKHELIDEASLIMTTALEKDDVTNAEKILKVTGAKLDSYRDGEAIMASNLYDYYIKTKEYDKARYLIEAGGYRRWGNHIKDVVVSLCEDGKKEEAKRYLDKYATKISDYDDLGKGRDNVIRLIKGVINTY